MFSFNISTGLLLYDSLVYVTRTFICLEILRECHDKLMTGHFGFAKTMELVSRKFRWPQQWKLVKEYLKTCDVCTRSKSTHHKPYGLLHPLPLSSHLWGSISIDFIIDLPPISGFNAILVVVDRLSKMAHFIATTKTAITNNTSQDLTANVFKLHRLLDDIVSDRRPQFTSRF